MSNFWRRMLHRNGTFVPPAPPTRTRRQVKTDFRRKTGRSGPFFHQSERFGAIQAVDEKINKCTLSERSKGTFCGLQKGANFCHPARFWLTWIRLRFSEIPWAYLLPSWPKKEEDITLNVYKVSLKKGKGICGLFLFQMSDFAFSHMFWNQNFKPVSSSLDFDDGHFFITMGW